MDYEEEQELVAQAKTDPEAFGELYRRYVKKIYNYHYHHTSSVSDAEDLTSQTFYRALRSLPGYRPTGAPFQAWLFRIAHNLVVNWYRDRKNERLVPLEIGLWAQIAPQVGSPESHLSTTELHESLVRVIDALPEDRKTLIILKFVEHMSNAEIAAVMGRTEGAIKALYHRTLISLRAAFHQGARVEDV